MKILRNGIAICACLFLTACDETYEGQLSLQQQITLKMKKDATLVVPMGTQAAKIKASSDKVKLKLKVGGKDQEVTFKMPKGVKIKSFNDVNIAPEVSGQPYLLRGAEKTEHSQSTLIRTNESCTYYTTETECGYVSVPRDCHDQETCHLTPSGRQCTTVPVCTGGGTEYTCRDVSVAHRGSQDVEYYMSYSTTSRQINIIEPASQQIIGNFSNVTRDSDKHYTYEGRCY